MSITYFITSIRRILEKFIPHHFIRVSLCIVMFDVIFYFQCDNPSKCVIMMSNLLDLLKGLASKPTIITRSLDWNSPTVKQENIIQFFFSFSQKSSCTIVIRQREKCFTQTSIFHIKHTHTHFTVQIFAQPTGHCAADLLQTLAHF